MLHPSLVRLLNKNVSEKLIERDEFAPLWQEISAAFYSYEREAKFFEHTSNIAAQDYERINQKLKTINEGLGGQLTNKISEVELLSHLPVIIPDPVIITDRDGTIKYINDAGKKAGRVLYRDTAYTFPEFLKTIIPQLNSGGTIQVEVDERTILFNFHEYEKENKIYFHGTDITEQVNLQRKAYENFYRLSNFLESTDSVYYIVYKNKSENNFFTSRWPLYFGFNPNKSADPLGEKRNCVLHENLREYDLKTQAYEKQGGVKIKYQVRNKLTNKILWLEEEIRQKFDPFLNDEVITGQITDITDKEILRESISETESRFRNITEAMPVMIWVSDKNNLVTYSNQKTKEFFGKGLEDFKGPEEFTSLVHPDSKILAGAHWKQELQLHKEVGQEYLLKNAAGEYHYVLEKAIPRFLPSGEFIGYIGAFFDLTKEFKINRELQKEKQQLELITRNSNDIILLTSLTGLIEYTSPVVKRVLDYESDDLIGFSVYDFFCTACREMVAPQITKTEFQLDGTHRFVFKLLARNGAEIWTESVISAIQNTSGEVSLLWHIRDINEQKVAFDRLKQSEETNRLIMQSAMDAIVCIDTAGKIIFWNQQAQIIFGWKDEEVLEKSFAEFVLPERLQAQFEGGIRKFKKSGSSEFLNRLLEINLKDHTGREFPAELSIIHINSEKQEFFCSFIRDVSERKRSLNALKESEERYRSIFENMSLGVMEVNTNEEITYHNQAMTEITGYTTDELIGRKTTDLFLPKKSQSSKILEEQLRIRSQKQSSVYELDVVLKNGNPAKWVISGAPLLDMKGSVKGSVGIHWDVTKIRQIEADLLNEKLNKEKAILEASLQAEEEQRSTIGRDLHDGVGQMLAYITLYLNMIKARGTYGPNEIQELQKSVGQTLEQVRTLSRNLTPPSIRDLGLREAVIELIQSYYILKKPVFKLSVFDAALEPLISMDKKIVMYRVLQELISNTFKYAESELITIHFEGNSNELILKYRDDGKGFDPENVKRGVGLKSISSRIQFHKGYVNINSKPGEGTYVKVAIPLNV